MQRALLVFLPAVTVLGACASENSVVVQARRLSTDQATFDAGQVAINDRETLDVLLYSTGAGDVTIVDIYTDDAQHWSVTPGWTTQDDDNNPDTLTLNGGSESDPDTAFFEVVFMPDSDELYRTTLTVVSNDTEVTEQDEDGNGLWKVVLRGIGRVPCGTVFPTFHDFGPRAAGGYFSHQATVENCGGVTLTIADFNPEGSTSFSVESATPVYVLPGESDTIELAYVPGGGSPAAEADIGIVSNAPSLNATFISVVGNDCDQSLDAAWDGDGDGWFPCAGDCDDFDSAINPSASERIENGRDDDCDGQIDETDDDSTAEDDDGDGWSEDAGDCHDGDADIHPDSEEVLNGVDDDCDGRIDEGTAWSDDDGDGFAERNGDCNDEDALVYPGAPELQNERDDDCNGRVDEGSFISDDDFDGFAEEGGAERDCNDADPWTFPGAAEDCDNRDNDCDGEIDEGEDGEPEGACAFLVERAPAAESEQEGCSTLSRGSGLAGMWVSLALVAGRRRRHRIA